MTMWQHSFMTQLLTMWQQYGNVDNLRRSCNCDSKAAKAAGHRNPRWLNAITTDFLTTKLMKIVTEDNGTARFQSKQLNWLDNSKTRSDWFENIDWLAFSPDSYFPRGHWFFAKFQALVWQQNLWITIWIFTFTCPTPGPDSWRQTEIQLQVVTRWQWWPLSQTRRPHCEIQQTTGHLVILQITIKAFYNNMQKIDLWILAQRKFGLRQRNCSHHLTWANY